MLIRPDSGLIFYKNTDQDCEDRKKFKMFTDPTLIKIHNFANYHKICNTVIYKKKKYWWHLVEHVGKGFLLLLLLNFDFLLTHGHLEMLQQFIK